MSSSPITPQQEEGVYQTYYGLRLGMVVLGLMLYCSIVAILFRYGCSQGSISGYYYTPARPVLIGTLVAIGVGLIIYRGNTTRENTLFDIAGFLAMMVAFVPTSPPTPGTGCNRQEELLNPDLAMLVGADAAREIENAYAERLNDIVSSATGISVFSLFFAAAAAIGLSRLLKPRFVAARPVLADERKKSLLFVLVLLGAGSAVYIYSRESFLGVAHLGSAILFFSLILWIIFLNAGYSKRPLYKALYRSIGFGTMAAAVVVLALWPLGIPGIFWLETVGIAGFIAFWLVQTKQLGGFVDRDATRAAGVRAGEPVDDDDG